MNILAIESSCDETAASVVADGRKVLSNVVASQVDEHVKYGGVVPEIASRRHAENISWVVDSAVKEAGVSYDDIDAVGVTYAPGLIGALLVGVNFAKGLSYSLNKPLIPVHHLRSHIASNYITFPELEPPFLALVVSGGHSHIIAVKDYTDFEILGRTRDDAAGEALDKAARAMGLDYPGGKNLDIRAKNGNPDAYIFPHPRVDGAPLDFSFSGIKTAVVNLMHNAEQKGETLNRADIAASFQRSVVDTLCQKAVHAAKLNNVSTLALAGGVSANTALRTALEKAAHRANLRFCRPDMRFCTDNAAMIACAAHYALLESAPSELSLNAEPSKELAE